MDKCYIYNDNQINFHYISEETPDQSNGGLRVHTHLFNELYFFIRGNATFKIEGTSYPLKPGDLLIMRHAESHAIELDMKSPYERISLHFDPNFITGIPGAENLCRAYDNRDFGKGNLFTPSDFSSPLYSLLLKQLTNESTEPRQQIISALIPVLNEIDKAFKSRNIPVHESADILSKRILDYINLHLSEDLSLDSLCRHFYISKPQLCRLFKADIGSTVWDYITVKRLMAAQKMIREGTPPTKAAIYCGFNDYSVFFRAYKKNFGSSPKSQFK